MTPERIEEIMAMLGWDDAGVAIVLGLRHTTSVRHWLSGRRPVPAPVAAWLERVSDWHAANPPPEAPGASTPG